MRHITDQILTVLTKGPATEFEGLTGAAVACAVADANRAIRSSGRRIVSDEVTITTPRGLRTKARRYHLVNASGMRVAAT